jgi:hypothetical protein
MYHRICDTVLKTGETVEIGVMTPPERGMTGQIADMLGHKAPLWLWHMELALSDATDTLASRFYVARRAGKVLSNICTFESGAVGILAHVWTPPAERRKGLCRAIMTVLLRDFHARGGVLMLLGTEYDTPPYHLYKGFGFAGYYEGSNLMRHSLDADFEEKYFAPSPARVVEADWDAWPRVNALVSEPEEFIKSVAYGRFYKDTVEEAYILLMRERTKDDRMCVKLLESEATSAIVGYAWTVAGKPFPGVYVLDLYCHPNHVSHYGRLLGEMKWPGGKVVAWVEAGMGEKARAVESAGFKLEATLRKHLVKRAGFSDLLLYSRSGR